MGGDGAIVARIAGAKRYHASLGHEVAVADNSTHFGLPLSPYELQFQHRLVLQQIVKA